MSSRPLLPLLLVAALAACGHEAPATSPARIEGLQTFQVQAAEAAGGRAWEGVVEAVRQATLSAQTNGRVVAVARDVNDRVAAGDVLVRLSAVEQQSGVDAARAQLANAGQQTDYTTVRAPYAGIVATRDVEPGESVGIGQTLMTVFAPGALRIEVAVPQSEADAIRANPAAVVTFDDGRRIDAADVTVFPAADASTHAVRVRVQLPALDAPPQPGLTAKVAFPAVKGAAFPRVPASALVRRGEVTAVYVLSDGRLSLRQVRLGDAAGEQGDVISGLKPGDRVATDPVAAQQALVAARKDG